jgi:sensor histidine kinase regulating citrate/malate metabolism
MSQTTIMTIIVLVVVFAIVICTYLYKKHIDYNEQDLEDSILKVFETNANDILPKSKFIMALKDKYKCTQKEALYLLGVARKNGIIEEEEKMISRKK